MALPLLDVMQSKAAAGTAALPPKRTAFFYVPNGVVQSTWQCEETGADFKLSPTLEPLESVREKIAVFSNLDRVKVAGTDGHAQASTCWLSSAAPDQLSPAGYPLRRTLDQIIADETSKQTPFRSLELSCNPYRDNRESIYFDNISWYGHGHVARSMRDPQRVFQRLFAVQREAEGDSVLDLVLADAKSLRPQLGALDRGKLDEYMESVRTVERQIERLASRRKAIDDLNPMRPATPWVEMTRGEYIQLMGELMILALRTDLTRVASLMVGPERWATPQVVDGVFDRPIVHHSMTHAQGDLNVRQDLSKLDRYHVDQFAQLVQKLDEVKEGDGSLLDNTMFVFGSGLSSGRTHVYSDLPIVIAGSGQGSVRSNRHLRSAEGTPVANLWLAVAQAMDVPLHEYGDRTGVIPLA